MLVMIDFVSLEFHVWLIVIGYIPLYAITHVPFPGFELNNLAFSALQVLDELSLAGEIQLESSAISNFISNMNPKYGPRKTKTKKRAF
jgi:hypothetical protein